MKSPHDFIEFNRIRDFGEVINATFDFVVQNLRVSFKAFLYIVGPILLLISILSGLWFGDMWTGLFAEPAQPASIDTAGYSLSMLFSVFSYLLAVTVFYAVILAYLQHGPGNFGVGHIWEITRREFWTVALTLIGVLLLAVIAAAINIVPCLGTLAYLGGLVYGGTVLSFVVIIRLVERTDFIDSIRRCFFLVRGYWWPTFGLIFIIYLITIVLSSTFSMPSLGMGLLTGLHGGAGATGTVLKLITIMTVAVSNLSVFMYLVPTLAITFQYFNLLERKEAPSLRDQIEYMAEEAPAGTDPDHSDNHSA